MDYVKRKLTSFVCFLFPFRLWVHLCAVYIVTGFVCFLLYYVSATPCLISLVASVLEKMNELAFLYFSLTGWTVTVVFHAEADCTLICGLCC